MKNNLVFCIACKHYESTDSEVNPHRCLSPENTRTKNTWLEPIGRPKRLPRLINKNNNCPNFTKPPTF